MSDYFITRENRFIDNSLSDVAPKGRKGYPEELATHLVSTGYALGRMTIRSSHDPGDIGWCYVFTVEDAQKAVHTFDITYGAYERIQSAFFKKRESNMDKKFALSENGNVYDSNLKWVEKPGKGLGDVVGVLRRCVERGLHVHYFSREHGQEPHWSTTARYGAMVEHIPFALSKDDYAELCKMTGALKCLSPEPTEVPTFYVSTEAKVFDINLHPTKAKGVVGDVLDLAKHWVQKEPAGIFVQSVPAGIGVEYYFGVEDVPRSGKNVLFHVSEERHTEIRNLMYNQKVLNELFPQTQGQTVDTSTTSSIVKDARVGDTVLYIFRHRGELVKRPAIIIAIRDLRADLHVFFKPDDRQESYIEGIVEGTREFHWCRRE